MTLRQLIYNSFTNDLVSSHFTTLFSNAIEEYFEGAKGTTIDEGTISSGVLVASSVTNSIKGDINSLKVNLENVMPLLEKTPSSTLFATYLAIGLILFTNNSIINCTVNGQATTSSSTTPIINAKSIGSLTTSISSDDMINYFVESFDKLNYRKNESIEEYNDRLQIGIKYIDSNDVLAYDLSEEIKLLFTTSTLNTYGIDTILGSIGKGSITFEE